MRHFTDFNLENFFEGIPTFDQTRKLLEDLDTERFYCVEEQTRIENEGIEVTKNEYLEKVELLICQVAHIVLNNAFFIISNGAEREFVYELTEDDKKDYRFSMLDFKHLKKIIYGGIEGTIDIIFDDEREIPDDDLDCQDMMMLATFMYDIVSKR